MSNSPCSLISNFGRPACALHRSLTGTASQVDITSGIFDGFSHTLANLSPPSSRAPSTRNVDSMSEFNFSATRLDSPTSSSKTAARCARVLCRWPFAADTARSAFIFALEILRIACVSFWLGWCVSPRNGWNCTALPVTKIHTILENGAISLNLKALY